MISTVPDDESLSTSMHTDWQNMSVEIWRAVVQYASAKRSTCHPIQLRTDETAKSKSVHVSEFKQVNRCFVRHETCLLYTSDAADE